MDLRLDARIAQQRDIKLAGFELVAKDKAVADGKLHAQARIGGAQRRDDFRQASYRHRFRRADAQGSLQRIPGAQPRLHLVEQAQYLFRILRRDDAVAAQFRLASFAFEELRAQGFFQFLDAQGNRRLRDIDVPGRGLECAQPGYGQQRFDLRERIFSHKKNLSNQR